MDKTLYVVTGFMRSGTSMMMNCLSEGGLDAAYSDQRDARSKQFADDHYHPNKGGLFELSASEHTKETFPADYEGRLIKSLRRSVVTMDTMCHGIRFIMMRRDPEEIRQSYNAFFSGSLRVRVDHELNEIKKLVEQREDTLSLHEFWYRDVLTRPEEHFNILKQSGWPIDTKKCVSVVDPKQCRFKLEQLEIGIP